jgi:hypothetical protein
MSVGMLQVKAVPLLNYHAMKMYEGEKVNDRLLTSATDVDEHSTSWSHDFIIWKRYSAMHKTMQLMQRHQIN